MQSAMTALVAFMLATVLCTSAGAGQPDLSHWSAVVRQAKGQTVYWNAWGGSGNVNDYIAWTGRQMEKRYGIRVVDVKVADTADAVAKVVAEKAAGRDRNGSVDLVWINGENFVAMKKQGLLMSPGWATKLPNWKYVDTANPTVSTDFNEPTDGLESPWGEAKLVFFYDSAVTKASELPDNAKELLVWAKAHPGRFSYPAPPDFIGSSFVKQLLHELIDDRSKLDKPVDNATFESDVAPLFAYLDELRPYLWRQGRAYPRDYPEMRQKLADGELGIIFAFNPSEASAAIELGAVARYRAFVHIFRRHPRQHPFRSRSLQRQGQGGRARSREFPDFSRSAAAQAEPGILG